ncbi:hypothetical protein [Xanthobacter autotrophicus]|uniref:hypothetical protein n=1 Tax=Xanthobacter autotrophicus TaxID=280 RepID=UPI0037286C2D
MNLPSYICASAVVILLSAAPAQATMTDLTIGTICIGNIPSESRVIKKILQENDERYIYEDISINYDSQKSSKSIKTKFDAPIIRIFKEIPEAGGHECSELKAKVLLEGTIERAQIALERSEEAGEKRAILRVKAGGFSVTIGRVSAGLAPIFGGSINLSGSKAWIENPSQLLWQEGRAGSGDLEITSWARIVSGAKFTISENNQTIQLDLSSKGGNIILRTPLTGRYMQFYDGNLKSTQVKSWRTGYNFESIGVKNATVDIDSIEIQAKNGQVSANVTGFKFQSGVGRVFSPGFNSSFTSSYGKIDRLHKLIDKTSPILNLAGASTSSLRLSAKGCGTKISGAQFGKSSECVISGSIDGSGRLDVVHSGRFESVWGSLLLPTDKSSLKWSSRFDKHHSQISGQVLQASFAMSELLIKSVPTVDLQPFDVTDLEMLEIVMPIGVDMAPTSGDLTARIGDREVIINGTVRRLFLNGKIVIPSVDVEQWRIEIPRGDLQFSFGVDAIEKAPILGGVANELTISSDVVNSLPVVSTSRRSEGALSFQAGVLAISNTKWRLGTDDSVLELSPLLRLDSGAAVTFDLASSRLALEAGTFSLAVAKMASQPSVATRIGGLNVIDAALSIQSLTGLIGGGEATLDLRNVSVNAKRISTSGDATDSSWSGGLERGHFGEIVSLLRKKSAKDSTLQNLGTALFDFSLALTDAEFGDKKGLSFSAANMSISGKTLTSDLIEQIDIEVVNANISDDKADSKISLSVPRLKVHLNDGTLQKPNGVGELHLAAIDATVPSPIEVKISCDGMPDFQKVPAKAHIVAPSIVMSLTVKNGQITGQGAAFPLSAEIKGDGRYECKGVALDFVLVGPKRWRTEYPCAGTWNDPIRTCEAWGETPAIAVTIDYVYIIENVYWSMSAPVSYINIVPDGSGNTKLKVCPKVTQFSPLLVDGSVFLTPRTPSELFNNFVKDIGNIVSRPFSASLLSQAGTLFAAYNVVAAWFGTYEGCK